MNEQYRYQNYGRDQQRVLLGNYYNELATANEEGKPVAYLFIPGNIAELLRVFDFQLVYPEIDSLQCAIKKRSPDLILKAEDIGYSSDVCGYVKTDVGLLMSGNEGPMGKLPKPDLLLCSYTGCTTFIHWWEALSHFYQVPVVMLDVPYMREDRIDAGDVAYVVGQLKELIQVCERISGKPYDEDKLKEILRRSVAAEEGWVRVLHAAKNIPSPFDAYFEAVFFQAPIFILRGTEECIDYYQHLWLEIEERMQHKLGPIPGERFRAVFEGPPPWYNFRAFWELFQKWGVCAVASSYAKVGGFWDHGLRHDPERPLESLAEYCLWCYTNQTMPMRSDLLASYVKEYHADALVINSNKSCRSFSMGQADIREDFTKVRGIPTLLVETDLVDPRYFQAAQLRNRIDAFFEALEHRKLVQV